MNPQITQITQMRKRMTMNFFIIRVDALYFFESVESVESV
jgi:hypothetical protein